MRLRQVLLNLVGNAIKYTERGAVRLHAETLHDADGRPRLRLCVEDTDPGIPARAQERLFQPAGPGADGPRNARLVRLCRRPCRARRHRPARPAGGRRLGDAAVRRRRARWASSRR
ncbi:hypothetical protein CKO31_18915 [Thiohalocapsa halophila]|uniref:Histidine kinase domain-containing protein n=1 Tax=Thiohalocapsa halophila TaxID=69359 RepID=A0ABS1CLH7_9GAMM|nr:hypothetical protein [Thiohalocapsa halophila]